ncbi:MAG: hypothetical protein WBP10_07550 [Thermoanaerobaculia bacterium]|jgi:hypothetical protein
MTAKKRILGLALPFLTLGVLLAVASLAAEQPDFSGTWKLNQELSENPREKMAESMSKGRGGEGGGKGGGRLGGGMSGGMRGGGGGRGGGREGMEERLGEREARIQQIVIDHEDPTLQIRFADDSENVFYTDGRMTEDLEAGLLEARASWKKGRRIDIERESPQGGAITEKYELSDDGSQLFVKTKMGGNGRMPKVSFERVYDRVPGFVQEPGTDDLTES